MSEEEGGGDVREKRRGEKRRIEKKERLEERGEMRDERGGRE